MILTTARHKAFLNSFLPKSDRLTPTFCYDHHHLAEYPPVWVLSFQYPNIIDTQTLDRLHRANTILVNLHFSLLPRYRGMGPISQALLHDEVMHGITYHLIDAGIDSGDIIARKHITIRLNDTAQSLYERCLQATRQTLPAMLARLENQEKLEVRNQCEQDASYFDRFAIDYDELRLLNPRMKTRCLWRRFRACYFPSYQRPVLQLGDQNVELDRIRPRFAQRPRRSGRVFQTDHGTVGVETSDGAVEILALLKNDEVVDSAEKIWCLLEG